MLHTKRYFSKRSILLIAVFVVAIVVISAVYHWRHIPDNVIAFTSTREGRPAIYLITPDGSYLRRLTPCQCCPALIFRFLNKISPELTARIPVFSEGRPFWSPDGQHIAYEDFYRSHLHMMDVKGTNRRLFSTNNAPLFITWSPDSSRVVFRSFDSLFISDGTQAEQIPYGFKENAPIFSPTLSPDLQKIAFLTRVEVTDKQILSYDICTTVIHGADLNCSSTRATSLPAWAPNSQAVAFGCHLNSAFALCILDINTYQTKEIALPPEIAHIHTDFFSIVWSPQNEKLAFVGAVYQTSEIYTLALYVVDANGSGFIRLTSQEEQGAYPSWSPDSSKIVFASTRNANWDLYIINADGTGLTRLTYDQENDFQPAWRPAR